jgi:hypothetical protein
MLAGITIPTAQESQDPLMQGQFDESMMQNPATQQPITLPESFGNEEGAPDGNE